MRAQGAWADALEELALAEERYDAQGLGSAVGEVYHERGEVLRLQGDLEASASAYAAAGEQGHDPQPGLSMLWLAQGRVDAAAAACGGCWKKMPTQCTGAGSFQSRSRYSWRLGTRKGPLRWLTSSSRSPRPSGPRHCPRRPPTHVDPSAWRRTILPLHFRTCARPGGDGSTSVRATRRLGRVLGSARRSEPWATMTRPAPSSSWPAGRSTSSARLPRVVRSSGFSVAARPDGLTARELEVLRLVAAGRDQPPDRHGAVSQREDGRPSPEQHLRQDEREVPHEPRPRTPSSTS